MVRNRAVAQHLRQLVRIPTGGLRAMREIRQGPKIRLQRFSSNLLVRQKNEIEIDPLIVLRYRREFGRHVRPRQFGNGFHLHVDSLPVHERDLKIREIRPRILAKGIADF